MAQSTENGPAASGPRIGQSPGLLQARPGAHLGKLHVLAYGLDSFEELDAPEFGQISRLLGAQQNVWLDVDGNGDVALFESLGELLQLDRLALEDVLSAHHRAKEEAYENHHFLVLHMPTAQGIEQVALFVGENWVLSVQERPGDCFEAVRQRIRDGRARIRAGGATYLSYALLDAVLDAYGPLLSVERDRLEDLEALVLKDLSSEQLRRIHRVQRKVARLRRAILPMRDLTRALLRDDSPLLSELTENFLRDCHDHAQVSAELAEALKDQTTALLNLYLTLQGQRMNEIMKVLTIIATIFIPLSFIAGLYGMNFDPHVSRWNMPELGWRYGYPFALGVMATSAAALLLWFRHKGWFR